MDSKNSVKDVPSRFLIGLIRKFSRPVSRLLWRMEFRNTENIPPPDTGGFIIAANHQTYFDPFWISIPFDHDIRYLAWDRVFEVPLLGRIIRRLGAIPVNLGRGGTLGTLRNSLSIVKSGASLMIFPEGERESSDSGVLPFRTGAVHIALKTGIPILPVTISGANTVWPKDYLLPRTGKVIIYFHPVLKIPVPESKVQIERVLEEHTELLKGIIQKPLNQSK